VKVSVEILAGRSSARDGNSNAETELSPINRGEDGREGEFEPLLLSNPDLN